MIRFLIRWSIGTVALLIILHVFSGISSANLSATIIMALVLGLLNAFLRPILSIFSFPIMVLTLGLFTLIINGFIFFLAAKLVSGFYVAGFWSAFWAAILYSVITFLINLLFGTYREAYRV
jgi:putative membrane protein